MWRVLIVLGWLYVAVMMALAQAFHPEGGLLSAAFVLLAYGLAPVELILYVLGTPARRQARRAREQAEQAQQQPAPAPGGGEAAGGAAAGDDASARPSGG